MVVIICLIHQGKIKKRVLTEIKIRDSQLKLKSIPTDLIVSSTLSKIPSTPEVDDSELSSLLSSKLNPKSELSKLFEKPTPSSLSSSSLLLLLLV